MVKEFLKNLSKDALIAYQAIAKDKDKVKISALINTLDKEEELISEHPSWERTKNLILNSHKLLTFIGVPLLIGLYWLSVATNPMMFTIALIAFGIGEIGFMAVEEFTGIKKYNMQDFAKEIEEINAARTNPDRLIDIYQQYSADYSNKNINPEWFKKFLYNVAHKYQYNVHTVTRDHLPSQEEKNKAPDGTIWFVTVDNNNISSISYYIIKDKEGGIKKVDPSTTHSSSTITSNEYKIYLYQNLMGDLARKTTIADLTTARNNFAKDYAQYRESIKQLKSTTTYQTVRKEMISQNCLH